MSKILAAVTAAYLVVAASPGLATTFSPNLHLVSTAQLSSLPIQDEEPSLRVDSTGRIFVSAIHGVPEGTDLFQVAPNGLSFIYRGMPDGLPIFNPNPLALAPGGGDTDLAIGSFSPSEPGPLVITSLNAATTFTSTTQDGGQSYLYNPNAGGLIVGQDRQWNASQGGLERYTVVHDLYTDNIMFARSLDGGLTWINGTPTTLPAASIVSLNNEIGPIAVDQVRHVLYNVFVSVASSSEPSGTPLHTIWIARSFDDGMNWQDVIVYNGPATASYNHLFPSMAVDGAGNVFAVWSDDRNVWLAYSTTQGATWLRPIRVTNSALDGYITHIFPWVAAGNNGGVDIVYYERIYSPDAVCAPGSPYPGCGWHVGFAQALNVIASPTFAYAMPSDHIIHWADICEEGTTCVNTGGNRNLADDFQIAIDPQGYANIAYTDDHVSTISPQVYFTKQTGGYSIGAPNGDVGTISSGAVLNGVTLTGASVIGRLKAPSWSPGWLTVLVNKQLVLTGRLTSYTAYSAGSAVFAGISRNGVPFAGSIGGGVFRVTAGLTTILATIKGGVLALL